VCVYVPRSLRVRMYVVERQLDNTQFWAIGKFVKPECDVSIPW